MAGDGISEAVRHFILNFIDSVGELEVLLLLHRDAGRLWTVEGVTRELRASPAWAQKQLTKLADEGLLSEKRGSQPNAYEYTPDADRAALIEEIACIYPQHRVTLTGLICEKPLGRLRDFADAFKIRKDK